MAGDSDNDVGEDPMDWLEVVTRDWTNHEGQEDPCFIHLEEQTESPPQ